MPANLAAYQCQRKDVTYFNKSYTQQTAAGERCSPLPRHLRQHRTIPALRLKHRSGSCRTSLAVSALRIMRYCLRKSGCLHRIFNVFYSIVTTGAHIVCPPTWRHINANAKTSHILTSRTHSKQPRANDVRPYQDI